MLGHARLPCQPAITAQFSKACPAHGINRLVICRYEVRTASDVLLHPLCMPLHHARRGNMYDDGLLRFLAVSEGALYGTVRYVTSSTSHEQAGKQGTGA